MPIIIIVCVSLIYYRHTLLRKLVEENRSEWDITLPQNSIMSGDYLGKIYENDYEVITLPNNVLSTLFVDYYLAHVENFFQEQNKVQPNIYEKEISQKEIEDTILKMFGPDYEMSIEPIEYGCGRYLKIENNTYKIGSRDPDSCGAFSYNQSSYLSYIKGYKKEQNEIKIQMKVAYVDIEAYPDQDDISYKIYRNKNKRELLNNHYDPKCMYDDLKEDACYENFSDYQITLLRASNHKYYFNKIEKIS